MKRNNYQSIFFKIINNSRHINIITRHQFNFKKKIKILKIKEYQLDKMKDTIRYFVYLINFKEFKENKKLNINIK